LIYQTAALTIWIGRWNTYEISTVENGFAEPADNFDPPSFVPPIYTRTWFHTGAYIKGEAISQHFAHEYYGAPAPNTPNFETVFEQFADTLLPDTILPDAPLSVAEQQEACRALKGMTLRQEVYAHDGSSKQPDPYTVSELNYTLKLVQPRGPNEHAVFFAHPRESINYHYERNAADPRVQHDLVLQVDAFGNAERMVSIAYPRGNVPGRLPEQEQTHVTLTLAWFINRDDEDDWYRAGLPAETRAYELVKPPRPAGRFTFDDISTLVTAMVPLNAREPLASKTIPNEDWDWRRSWNETMEPGGVMISRLRPMDHVRTLYRKDDPQNSSDLLPLGEIESRALTGEAYKLAFTTSLLSKVFRRGTEDLLPSPASVLTTDGGYLEGDSYRSMSSGLFPLTDAPGQWWIRSGRVFLTEPSGGSPGSEIAFARANFFLPRRFVD